MEETICAKRQVWTFYAYETCHYVEFNILDDAQCNTFILDHSNIQNDPQRSSNQLHASE